MTTKKKKITPTYDEELYDGIQDDADEDADVEYLRRTTDRRHKVDYEPEDLDFND